MFSKRLTKIVLFICLFLFSSLSYAINVEYDLPGSGKGSVTNTEGGPPVSFNLAYEENVVAGRPYEIIATDAIDQFGDPANGVIKISLQQDGTSPSGFEPILNDIYVLDGSGSAKQYLFKTGTTVLSASVDSVVHEITLTVLPGELGDLVLNIQPTQFVGNLMIGPASIVAYDTYGNVKTDFDASVSPVTISINRGELNPDVLSSETDFVDGIADLEARGLVFDGAAGIVRMSVSAGPIVSNWIDVIYNMITFRSTRPLPGSIAVSHSFGLSALALNYGNIAPLSPVIFNYYFASCPELCGSTRLIPPVPPNDSLQFSWTLSTDNLQPIDIDTLIISIESEYFFANDTIATRHTVVHPVKLIEPAEFEYIENSLSIDTVMSPSTVDTIRVRFTSEDELDLVLPVSRIDLFIDVGQGDWLQLYPPGWYMTSEDDIFTFRFYDIEIPDFGDFPDFAEGFHPLKIEGYFYDRDSYVSLAPIENFDSFYVAFPSGLSYRENSLSPEVVYDGMAQPFEFDIYLDGSTTIQLDPFSSRFELSYDNGSLVGFIEDSISLVPGANHLATRDIYIPDLLIGKELTPCLILLGLELYVPRIDTILFGIERILVSDHILITPRIKVASTELITINPPFVNIRQKFSVSVSVENLSEIHIDSVSLFIQSEDGSETFGELHDLVIPAASTLDTAFSLVAPDVSTSSVIYKAVVSAPDVSVLPPDDNTVAVTFQSPAEIELIYALHDTHNGYVDYDQPFSITAHLENRGEAEAGPGEISLITGGYDFGVPDSSYFALEIDSIGVWQLTAPIVQTSANLTLKITEVPIDRNTGQPAVIRVGLASILIMVEPSTAELIVNVIVGQTSLIVEGTLRELFWLELKNDTQNSLNVVGLTSIVLQVADRSGSIISPDLILSITESGFCSGQEMITVGEIHNNRLRLEFDQYQLGPGAEDTIVFVAQFNDEMEIKSFNLSIDSRDIRAVFVSGPRVNQSVPVRGKFEDSFRTDANFVVVVPGLEKSLMVRNNPFNPKEGPAEIAYLLGKDTDIEIAIYTLLGEKVYDKSFPAGTSGGMKGQNYFNWDGRNDEGRTVLNGVYVVVVKSEGCDESCKLKLAVRK